MQQQYMIIGDPGKDTTKVIGCNLSSEDCSLEHATRISFRTRKLELTEERAIDCQGNTYKVCYEGKTIYLGDQGIVGDYETRKTKPLHQLSLYTAITQLLTPDTKDNEISLILACPVTVLASESSKNEYKDFIKGSGMIKITVDDKNYAFTIKDVVLKAEGLGVLYELPSLFQKKVSLVVDFGGLNMTVTLLTNGICKNPLNDRFALEFGYNQLKEKIGSDLSVYLEGAILTDADLETTIERGYLLLNGQPDLVSKQKIEQAKSAFFQEAMTELTKRKINVSRVNHVVFIGGTTLRLLNQIATIPNHYLTEDSQWTSVEGLYTFGLKYYRLK